MNFKLSNVPTSIPSVSLPQSQYQPPTGLFVSLSLSLVSPAYLWRTISIAYVFVPEALAFRPSRESGRRAEANFIPVPCYALNRKQEPHRSALGQRFLDTGISQTSPES